MLKPKRPASWPAKSGYYLVENTIPEGERLDGGKGAQTIRRVFLIEVVTEGRNRYQFGSDRYPSWQAPGAYVVGSAQEGWQELWSRVHEWDGLRFVYLDLDAIGEATP